VLILLVSKKKKIANRNQVVLLFEPMMEQVLEGVFLSVSGDIDLNVYKRVVILDRW
jgi:hypothetical protein